MKEILTTTKAADIDNTLENLLVYGWPKAEKKHDNYLSEDTEYNKTVVERLDSILEDTSSKDIKSKNCVFSEAVTIFCGQNYLQ